MKDLNYDFSDFMMDNDRQLTAENISIFQFEKRRHRGN